jgi:dihydroorotase-like cyclic amidohydrolase
MEAILIKGATVIDPVSELEEQRDVRVAGGAITALDRTLEIQANDTVINANGLWLCPGFIDIHTHLRDLGQIKKISTPARALLPRAATRPSSRWRTLIRRSTMPPLFP